jgi:hypothetical protein
MQGMTEFIREHEDNLKKATMDEAFLSYHLTQICFLQHERLVHLVVMLFVIACTLFFLGMFLFLQMILFLVLFLLLLVVTLFYVLHYFKLENTVIKWYFTYNENQGGDKEAPTL